MEEGLAKKEVITACAELVKRGLVARTWGNISCRIDDKCFAITPSGIAYEKLKPETIVVVDIDTLQYRGNIKPSSEKGIHASAYKLNSKTNFVIHTHQTYASCLSVAGFASIEPAPEEKAECEGEILLAEYGLPGTGKLSKNVAKKFKEGSSVILMERHGAVIASKDRDSAFKRAVLLEKICQRAISPLDFTDAEPDGISFWQGSGKLIHEVNGSQKEYSLDAGPLPRLLMIHAALLPSNPDAGILVHRSSAACDAVLRAAKKLPAMLDDFAQMAGNDAKCVSSGDTSRIAEAMRGRNGALVSGLGALCHAEDMDDAKALLTLMEKNALAFLHAGKFGKPAALPWIDRKLMRLTYLKKYSKKK